MNFMLFNVMTLNKFLRHRHVLIKEIPVIYQLTLEFFSNVFTRALNYNTMIYVEQQKFVCSTLSLYSELMITYVNQI